MPQLWQGLCGEAVGCPYKKKYELFLLQLRIQNPKYVQCKLSFKGNVYCLLQARPHPSMTGNSI